MKQITDKICAIVPVDDPSPLAYMNVFEEGDIWLKTQDCSACPEESRARCCNKCFVFTPSGCGFQRYEGSTDKPFQCVVKPTPRVGLSYCQLEFTCIKGSKSGKVRRVRESLEEIEN